MTEAETLVSLAAQLAQAKRDESEARATRIMLEEQIVAKTGFAKPEGAQSYDSEGPEGSCKFTLSQPINTTVDGDAWVKLRRTLDAKHPGRGVFQTKYSLDKKAAAALQASDKKAWAEVSSVVTRKPGKISVELKEVAIKFAVSPEKKVGELGPREHKGRIMRPDVIGEEA